MRPIIKKLLLIITIYIGLILISTNVYAKSGKTTNETTRLRKEASANSSIVALISQDEEVEITGEEGDWYKVKYSNYSGYIRKDMLSVEEDVSTENTVSNTTQSNNETEQQNETSNTAGETQNESEITDNTDNLEANQNTSTESENINLQIGYTGNLTSKLDIKILPSINSSMIATITENTQFTITEIINKWCYIETENNSGWVLLSKVKADVTSNETSNATSQENNQEEKSSEDEVTKEESKEESKEDTTSTTSKKTTTVTKYVATETLNVRESADNSAKIVSQLTINTQITIVEVVDSTWSKIKVKGTTGYVASKYLSDTKTDISSRSENLVRESTNTNEETTTSSETKTDTSSNTTTSSKSGTTGADIVQYAQKYLNYKYVSGGTSPQTGFDCSGFTYYVYKNFGITLSRTSTAQASNGVAVSKSNLQAGDLVIFNNSSNTAIGHVGVYIGGNTFIHAANSSKGVITTSLSDSYYSARFVTARRIIN